MLKTPVNLIPKRYSPHRDIRCGEFSYTFSLTDCKRTVISCSGVGAFPPNCDQNNTASGSVEDIPSLIAAAISLRTSLTDTPFCFATCLISFFIIDYSFCRFVGATILLTVPLYHKRRVEKTGSVAGNKKSQRFLADLIE